MVHYFTALLGLCAAFLLHAPMVSCAAVASPANASSTLDVVLDGLVDSDVILDEDTLLYLEGEGLLYNETATASDATLDEILLQVSAIRNAVSPEMESEPDEMEDMESGEILLLSSDAGSFPDHDVILMSGTFGGTDYTLVVPADVYPLLYVDENGVLYNISSSNITCRMFPDHEFTPTDYNYNNLVLYPVLGSSAGNLYRYGSLSYRQYYYKGTSSTSLSSSTEYGYFYVDDIKLQRSLSVDYRIYYVTVVCFFLLGVIVLCSWKNLRR